MAARKLLADRLLAGLGFVPLPDAVGQVVEADGDRPARVSFRKARLALVQGDDKVRVVRGNDVLAEDGRHGDTITSAMLLPGRSSMAGNALAPEAARERIPPASRSSAARAFPDSSQRHASAIRRIQP